MLIYAKVEIIVPCYLFKDRIARVTVVLVPHRGENDEGSDCFNCSIKLDQKVIAVDYRDSGNTLHTL